jgi:hypothetical protein
MSGDTHHGDPFADPPVNWYTADLSDAVGLISKLSRPSSTEDTARRCSSVNEIPSRRRASRAAWSARDVTVTSARFPADATGKPVAM